jgi:hypothetical protein
MRTTYPKQKKPKGKKKATRKADEKSQKDLRVADFYAKVEIITLSSYAYLAGAFTSPLLKEYTDKGFMGHDAIIYLEIYNFSRGLYKAYNGQGLFVGLVKDGVHFKDRKWFSAYDD